MSQDYVEVYFEKLKHETDLAWLIIMADGDEVWLPKSQCELDEDDNRADVPEWLAIEKGLA